MWLKVLGWIMFVCAGLYCIGIIGSSPGIFGNPLLEFVIAAPVCWGGYKILDCDFRRKRGEK